MIRIRLLMSSALLTGITLTTAAGAQGTNSTNETQTNGDSLQEIIITAQRREERAIDVPISITAATGDQLAAQGITRSWDLTQVVPGLRIDADGPFVQPTLRGIGNAIAGPGVNPAVATYIDGFYQPSELSSNFDLLGVSSVEVLKGPQGTLFGRNATGGAIVVNTLQPSFDTHVDALLGYGKYNEWRAQVYASTGLTDTLAASIALSERNSDGFSRDVTTGSDSGRIQKWTARAKLLWKPSDDFSATFTFERTQGHDDSAVAYDSFHGLNNVAALLGVLGLPTPPEGVIAPSTRGVTAANAKNGFYGQDDKAYLTLRKEFGEIATLTSYTQYQKEDYTYAIDFDATNVPLYSAVQPSPITTFTQELDLASNNSGNLQWAAGLYYYFNQSTDAPYFQTGSLIDGTGTNTTNAFYTQVNSRAYAAFADVTYRFLDKFYFTVGGRESLEDQFAAATSYPDGIPTTVPPAFGGGAPPGDKSFASQDFHSFTPRGVLRYNFAPEGNVFASYSEGFKAGGYSPTDFSLAPAIPRFEPEKVHAYEVGLKDVLGRIRVESSVYYNHYLNQQVAYYTSGVGHVSNAASSEIYGVELAVSGKVTSQITVGANGAWTHGRYVSFPNATQSLLSGTFSVNISGQPMERTPQYTANVYANFEQPVGDGKLTFNASCYYTTKYRLDPPGDYNQDGYGLVNARVTYTLPGGRFSVAVLGNNITNTHYTASILPFTPFAILQEWGNPATWGVEADYKY